MWDALYRDDGGVAVIGKDLLTRLSVRSMGMRAETGCRIE